MPAALSADLLGWYADSGRDLPWRRTRDPYAIWVSEVMLQQTRVETVLPYYERFLRRFPNTETLAKASVEEVLQVWEGLGYYSRARHLHQAANLVVVRSGGELPHSRELLEELPGIGRYAASAIAAIAYGQDTLALEGNLRRVLARLFDLHLDPRSSEGERTLRELGDSILPRGKASEFNQAMMDLGALICTPRAPACTVCPLEQHCLAHRRGTQHQLPVRAKREPLSQRLAVAAVWQLDGSVLVRRNPAGGLLGGLWSFPGGLLEQGETPQAGLRRLIDQLLGIQVQVGDPMSPLQHSYSHYKVTLQPYRCRFTGRRLREREDTRWIELEELRHVPMGKLDRKLAEELQVA